MFKGIYTALLTPFNQEQKLDHNSINRLLAIQANSQHISGVVIAGTTGESPCLQQTEIQQLLKCARDNLRQEQKIILGISTNSLVAAYAKLELYNTYPEIDAYMVVTPYYNKPSQTGLINYYTCIANQAKKPVILYNVPSRTGVDLQLDSILELAANNNIVGIKEASEDLDKIKRLCRLDLGLNIFSGNDHLNTVFAQLGSDSVISVLSNIAPELVAKQLVEKVDHPQTIDFLTLLAKAGNPVAIKSIAKALGIIDFNVLRPPLVAEELDLASKNYLGSAYKYEIN